MVATLGKWWQPWAAQRSHWFRLSFIEVKYAAKVVFICELFLFNWFCWFRIKNIINYVIWIHFNMLHIDKHNTLECARNTNMCCACGFHWIMATTNGGNCILVVAIIYMWWQPNILGHMPNVAIIGDHQDMLAQPAESRLMPFVPFHRIKDFSFHSV